MNALVLQLQTALNKSLDQIASLQQQLASLQQQSQAGVQLQPSYNAAAAKEPVRTRLFPCKTVDGRRWQLEVHLDSKTGFSNGNNEQHVQRRALGEVKRDQMHSFLI